MKILIFTRNGNVKKIYHKVCDYLEGNISRSSLDHNNNSTRAYVATKEHVVDIMSIGGNIEWSRGYKANVVLYDGVFSRREIDDFFYGNVYETQPYAEGRDKEVLVAPVGIFGCLVKPELVYIVSDGKREGIKETTIVTHDFLKAFSYTKAILGTMTCCKCEEENGVLWQSSISSDNVLVQESFINMIARGGDDSWEC